MNDIDLQAFLTDLVVVQNRDETGTEFMLSFVERDCFDQLIVSIPCYVPSVKICVCYDAYPAVPTIKAHGDHLLSVQVAAELQQQLQTPISMGTLIDKIVKTAAHKQRAYLDLPIREICFSDAIYNQILIDYNQYTPNEYAFICSGTINKNGIIIIGAYYPGDMEVSTPVYCELTADFINKTVYEEIPQQHNIIVWGHVHPIESPSGTDESSFDELAQWDREVATIGMIQKRSLALLISSHSGNATFHDVATHDLIPHLLFISPTQ